MLKRALRAVAVVGIFGLLFGSVEAQWRAPHLGMGNSEAAKATAAADLSLISSAFARTVGNQPPVAYAGLDRTATAGDAVLLDGRQSSDADGDRLSVSWQFVSIPHGSLAVLSDHTRIKASFDVDIPGDHIVQLIANNGTVDSSPGRVTN
jgi:hypothetical protein